MHKKVKDNMKEAFLKAVSALPQEDRKTLADAMEEMHQKHHGHHHWGHKDEKSPSDSDQ
jgi:hypothetical protein